MSLYGGASWTKDDYIQIIKAKGPKSLTKVMAEIRANTNRTQFRRIVAASVRPAASWMAEKLRQALPRRSKAYPDSHHRFGIGRYPGALRDSIRFQFVPAPKFKPWWSPIARVQAISPHGYVLNFLKGSKDRPRRVKKYKGKPVAAGKGSRGTMRKLFDPKAFAMRHSAHAQRMIVEEAARLINADNLTRPARRIPFTPINKHLKK